MGNFREQLEKIHLQWFAGGAGVQATGAFSYLLNPDYSKIFYDEYAHTPEQFSKVAKMQSSDKGYVKEAVLAGFGQAATVDEGNPIVYDYVMQGFPKSVTHTKKGLGFQITEEMWDDDQSGLMRGMPKELGRSLAWTRDVVFWDLFNDGDDTYKSADGDYIFSTSHTPLRDGSDQANTPSSAGSLSLTTYEAALESLKGIKNEAGMPLIFTPKLLIVPQGLEWKAKELQLSPSKPYTADNEINPVADEGLTYLVCRFLDSSYAWFVTCSEHDVRFIWRKKVAFKNSDDFNTGNALFKATERFSVGAWDWRGVYGNFATS